MPQAAKQSWRLRKTLSRKVGFRPVEQEDVRYVWAAYKKGALASMGPDFADTSMDAEAFRERIGHEVVTNYHAAWVLLAETSKGYMPVGMVLGFWSHPNVTIAPFMIVGDMVWFPWATTRNVIESAVNFFNEIRREIPLMEYAHTEDKPFFEVMMRHGIMRRVGTSHNVHAGEPAAVYETRAP